MPRLEFPAAGKASTEAKLAGKCKTEGKKMMRMENARKRKQGRGHRVRPALATVAAALRRRERGNEEDGREEGDDGFEVGEAERARVFE